VCVLFGCVRACVCVVLICACVCVRVYVCVCYFVSVTSRFIWIVYLNVTEVEEQA